jgi:hypothetical protein
MPIAKENAPSGDESKDELEHTLPGDSGGAKLLTAVGGVPAI